MSCHGRSRVIIDPRIATTLGRSRRCGVNWGCMVQCDALPRFYYSLRSFCEAARWRCAIVAAPSPTAAPLTAPPHETAFLDALPYRASACMRLFPCKLGSRSRLVSSCVLFFAFCSWWRWRWRPPRRRLTETARCAVGAGRRGKWRYAAGATHTTTRYVYKTRKQCVYLRSVNVESTREKKKKRENDLPSFPTLEGGTNHNSNIRSIYTCIYVY